MQARVWSAVFGEEYPAEVAPFSFISRSELQRMATDVTVGAGDLLVDVGSGRGGPGLWVAATTGSDYLAVDITEAGLAEVKSRAAGLGLGDRVRTKLGSFEEMPLENDEAAGLMSVDALLFTPNKAAALAELARVLRRGGRLVFTTWDYHRQPAGRPPQVADHRPLLEDAGLEVLAYEETDDWEARHREITRLLMDSVDELAAETGRPTEEVRAGQLEMAATVDAMLRRVLVVAERR